MGAFMLYKNYLGAFSRHSGFFSVTPGFSVIPGFSIIPGFFLCHSGASRNPSFSCDLGIAKEREARAFYAGFRLSPE